jgi:hypothetical protein
MTQDLLLARLKSFNLPKTKYQSVEVLLKSYQLASNYHHHMKSLECASMNEELKFYRSSYGLQKSYVESIITLFRIKYEQFIGELRENFYEPLRLLIGKFWQMKSDSSELNLKEFLNTFKLHAKKFERILDGAVAHLPDKERTEATFGELMIKLDLELDKLNQIYLNDMKKSTIDLESLKQMSNESDQLLVDFLRPDSPDND